MKKVLTLALILSSSVFAGEVCKSWATKQGGGFGKPSADISGEACLNAGGITGNTTLWARANGYVKAGFMGQNIDIATAEAMAKAPEWESPSVTIAVKVLGNQIYAYEKEVPAITYEQNFVLPPLEKTLNKIVFIGPVPLNLGTTIGAQGAVKVAGSLTPRSAQVTATPYFKGKATAFAQVGSANVKARIFGEVKLVESSLSTAAKASLSFEEAQVTKPILMGLLEASHQTEALQGRIAGSIEIPTGVYDKEIYAHPGFTWEGTLLRKEFKLPLRK